MIKCGAISIQMLAPHLKLTPQEYITDFDLFQSGNILVIDKGTGKTLDWPANTRLTYKEWVETYVTYSGFRVSGLEQNKKLLGKINKHFNIRAKDLHLFVNQTGGYSFDWHKDDVDVILMVAKGRKHVYTNRRSYCLTPGQFVFIPKGVAHKVYSAKNTVALSVGI